MHRYGALIGLVLACLPVTSVAPRFTAGQAADGVNKYGSPAAQALAIKAFDLWKQGRYAEAASICRSGYADAIAQGRDRGALFFLNTQGSSYFSLGNYTRALDSFLQARDLALNAGLSAEAAISLSNLSALYLHVFESASALAASEEAYHLVRHEKPSLERSRLLLQLGRVLILRKRPEQAAAYFAQAVAEASLRGDPHAEAFAWDQMGLAWLDRNDLARAEAALTEAFRIRRLARDPDLVLTEYKLARLYLGKRNLPVARRLIDAVFEQPLRDHIQVPLYHLYLTRGRIRRAQGDLRGALDDYLAAAANAEEWRSRVLSADSFRVSAGEGLNEIFDDAVEIAVHLYLQTRDARYAIMAWEFCERNRSASLRELLTRDRLWSTRLPKRYWAALERLRTIEAEQLAGGEDRPAVVGEAARIRMQLAEWETLAGASSPSDSPLPAFGVMRNISRTNVKKMSVVPENFLTRVSLKGFQEHLGNSRTLISFRLGESVSYRWVITRNGFDLTLLPPRRELAGTVGNLCAALSSKSRRAVALAKKAYSDLFSGMSDDRGAAWQIELDDELFRLPLSALVVEIHNGRPVYLIEQRSVQVVPGAWAIGAAAPAGNSDRFIGVGDGVFNTADRRYRAGSVSSWLNVFPRLIALDKGPMQFPRLFGSLKEVTRAAELSNASERIVLTGVDVTRRRLLEVLAREPRMIHFATHFVTTGSAGGNAAIVLGVHPDGAGRPRLDLLTREDIAGLRVPGAVVVLSGCSSAAGPVAPASGVLGLARAWLAAGAKAVIATHWPTTDDTGELFSRFYRHESDSNGSDRIAPAEALRRAQVDMLRSGTWRSDPYHWAAYEIVGRSN